MSRACSGAAGQLQRQKRDTREKEAPDGQISTAPGSGYGLSNLSWFTREQTTSSSADGERCVRDWFGGERPSGNDRPKINFEMRIACPVRRRCHQILAVSPQVIPDAIKAWTALPIHNFEIF